MPKPEDSPSAIFLNQVRQQLNSLEPAEQCEILAELATHLHDAVAGNEAASNASAAAEAAAVRAMGDPVAVGRRLRDEHLNVRLSLPAALLCALPLGAIALLFARTDLYFMMRNFGRSNSGFPFSFLLALTPILALSLVLLARTRQNWPATLLGGVGLLFLLGLAHGIRGAQYAPLAFIGLGILLLATISLTLGVALRCAGAVVAQRWRCSVASERMAATPGCMMPVQWQRSHLDLLRPSVPSRSDSHRAAIRHSRPGQSSPSTGRSSFSTRTTSSASCQFLVLRSAHSISFRPPSSSPARRCCWRCRSSRTCKQTVDWR